MKKLWQSLTVLVLAVLLVVVIQNIDYRLPEESNSSQEVSVLGIDCYENVENYRYSTSASRDGNTIHLKNINYSFLDAMHIPGMPGTKVSDLENHFIYSLAQCPQGLCVTDDFFLITSYSSEKGCLGEMMVFDQVTGEYLVTLGMDEKSHLGGITFDGKNVWVCNSNENSLERISYDFVKLMAIENRGKTVDCSEVVDSYEIETTPSCLTFQNDRIWTATFHSLKNGEAVAYHYDYNEDKLVKLSSYELPNKVQGIAFDSDGRVYLSCSYGRKNSSFLKIYEDIYSLSADPSNPALQIEMPPCSEEIVLFDGCLYMVFESAGEKYLEGTDGKGRAISPIDKILMLNVVDFSTLIG